MQCLLFICQKRPDEPRFTGIGSHVTSDYFCCFGLICEIFLKDSKTREASP